MSTSDDGPLLLRARHGFDGSARMSTPSVLVADETLTAVGDDAERRAADAGVAVVDLGDRTLLPGLIDAHLHLLGRRAEAGSGDDDRDLLAIRAGEDAARLLHAGFTTVRDCGGGLVFGVRAAIAEGVIPGPRIVASGPMMSQTGGHADGLVTDTGSQLPAWATVDGEQDLRLMVRRSVRAGADFIKICTTGGIGSPYDSPHDVHYTEAEVRAVVDEAHRLGRPVAAHAQGKEGVLHAVRCGVDTIEHAYFLDEDVLEAMLAAGTQLVPTFGLIERFTMSVEQQAALPAHRVRKQRGLAEAMTRAMALWAPSKLVVASGSDYLGSPGRAHGDNADDVISMWERGLPAERALRAVTHDAARVCRVKDRVGRLTTGFVADVVAAPGDVLADVSALRQVDAVMRAGHWIRRPDDRNGPAVTSLTSKPRGRS